MRIGCAETIQPLCVGGFTRRKSALVAVEMAAEMLAENAEEARL